MAYIIVDGLSGQGMAMANTQPEHITVEDATEVVKDWINKDFLIDKPLLYLHNTITKKLEYKFDNEKLTFNLKK